MAISSDVLLERLHLKRQITLWRTLVIVGVVLFLVFLTEGQEDISPVTGDYIARVEIADIVVDDYEFDALLDKIKHSDNAKALMVVLDTPGGTAVGGESLYHRLRSIAKVKPVVAVMRTMCASAGYMIAMGADRVIAMRSTLTGSIGVLVQTAQFTELAKKLGITPITVKSGSNKAAPSPAEEFTPEQRIIIQGVIDDFYDVFVDIVAESRKMSADEVKKISDGGRIFSGQQALKVGLVDQIGGEEEALAWLKKEKGIDDTLEVRDMKVKEEYKNLIDKFANYTGFGWLSEKSPKLEGLLLIWRPSAL